jgi:hypothetical protein
VRHVVVHIYAGSWYFSSENVICVEEVNLDDECLISPPDVYSGIIVKCGITGRRGRNVFHLAKVLEVATDAVHLKFLRRQSRCVFAFHLLTTCLGSHLILFQRLLLNHRLIVMAMSFLKIPCSIANLSSVFT